MNRYLLLATVQDRIPMAAALFASIKAHLAGWKVLIVAQEYSDDEARQAEALTGGEVINLSARVGPHRAKIAGLQTIVDREGANNFVVCSIDDDMEFLPQTNLDPAVSKALTAGTGFVSCGWAPHLNRIRPGQIKPIFVRQAIVYTGGGMVFGPKVARLVLTLPPANYFDDNTEWSLAAYTAGLSNFRWRGSMTLHKICSKGGRRAWVALRDRVISDPKLITIREGKLAGRVNNYLVGSSADLTPLAHELHQRHRRTT